MLWSFKLVFLFFYLFSNFFKGLNLDKRLNVKFVPKEKLKKHVRSIKLVSVEPTDNSGEIFEVREKKHVIQDCVPVQCGAMILSTAKLHFVKFVRELVNKLDCTAFRILYMGKTKNRFSKITQFC